MKLTWRLLRCLIGKHNPVTDWIGIFAGKQIKVCADCGKIVEQRSGQVIEKSGRLRGLKAANEKRA